MRVWQLLLLASPLAAAASCYHASPSVRAARLSPAERAAALAVAIRDEAQTVGPRVAINPLAAWPESSLIGPAGRPDTVKIGRELFSSLLARPEVAGSCVPQQPGPDMASYCDVPDSDGEPVRYAVRFSEPEELGKDTVTFLVSFHRVRPRSDTSSFAPGFAYGLRYRVARRGPAWVVLDRRETFIT
jgi:hypothetical protein